MRKLLSNIMIVCAQPACRRLLNVPYPRLRVMPQPSSDGFLPGVEISSGVHVGCGAGRSSLVSTSGSVDGERDSWL